MTEPSPRRKLESIQGLLNTPRGPAGEKGAITAQEGGSSSTAEDRPDTASARTAVPPRRPASSTVVMTRPISFTTPVDVRQALRDAAIRNKMTLTQVILEAIETHVDQLTDLVAGERVGDQPPGETQALFPDRPSIAQHTASETRVAVSLRLTSRNLEVIDHLVESHGAQTRSDLITAALRAHLPPE